MSERPFTVDQEQILRFSGPGPRYTSYPTVPEWYDVGEDVVRAAYERAAARPERSLSLYVHIPFCERRCLFCGCTVDITRSKDRVTEYLDALDLEIGRVAERMGERRRVSQLHLGGGTPTHLSPEELRRLHGSITRRFEIEPGAEVSLEVHPHVTTHEQIDVLTELGYNRISMGVQDVDPHVQAVIHRDQTVAETVDLVAHCRARGVLGVNLDLMYGLPAQTEATFGATLDTVAEIRPDRLAVYGYAHVPWLKKHQTVLEREGLPDPVLRAKLFATAVERLCGAGYEVIGLDHFALATDELWKSLLAGTLHRNFMGYTTQRAEDMLAFGMSAIGDVGGTFLQNERETKPYVARVHEGGLAAVKGLVRTPDDDLRRAVIQDLMCRMRVDLDDLEARFDRDDLGELFAGEWEGLRPFEAEGFCRVTPRTVEVLPTGRLFLRHLAMLFDAYLKKKEAPSASPRFSQTL